MRAAALAAVASTILAAVRRAQPVCGLLRAVAGRCHSSCLEVCVGFIIDLCCDHLLQHVLQSTATNNTRRQW